MGGDITRTAEYDPFYANRNSFGIGKVHKLITIGTPHLGTPLASQLLDAANTCLRTVFTQRERPAFSTVVPDGSPQLNGAVGDLHGDGTGANKGANLSAALNTIRAPNAHETPTALIAAKMAPSNTNGLLQFWERQGLALYLSQKACKGRNEPLIGALTSGNWSSVFGGHDSDGIVPVSSQGGFGDPIPGVIHSDGIKFLGFSGSSELDSDAETGIPSKVIQLLNTPLNASSGSGAFHFLTHQ